MTLCEATNHAGCALKMTLVVGMQIESVFHLERALYVRAYREISNAKWFRSLRVNFFYLTFRWNGRSDYRMNSVSFPSMLGVVYMCFTIKIMWILHIQYILHLCVPAFYLIKYTNLSSVFFSSFASFVSFFVVDSRSFLSLIQMFCTTKLCWTSVVLIEL